MRDVYAVHLRFDPGGKRAPLARALVRQWAAGHMGGTWPAGTNPLEGRWSSPDAAAQRTAVSWRDRAHARSSVREVVVTRPHQDRSLRWVDTVQVGVDAETDEGFVAWRTSVRSTSPVLSGSVQYTITPPPLIAELCDALEVTDAGHQVRSTVIACDTVGVDALLRLLTDPTRALPVAVCGPEVDIPDGFTSSAAGLAHVITLTTQELETFAAENGPVWPVPPRGLRLFWAGWVPADAAARHPSFGPAELGADTTTGRQWWSLLRVLYATSALRINEPGLLRRIELAGASQRRDVAKQVVDAGGLTDAEVAEAFDLWDADTRELQQVRHELADALAELEQARVDREALIETLTASLRHRPAADPAPTASSEDLPATMAEVLSGASRLDGLAVSPEAEESVKRCVYQHPDRAHTALVAVAELARRWRADDLPAGFKPEALAAGLPWRGGLSDTAKNQYADDYTATWNGDKVLCEQHLAFGANTGPAHHLRMYLYLDRDTRTVVLGPFGRHGRDASNP